MIVTKMAVSSSPSWRKAASLCERTTSALTSNSSQYPARFESRSPGSPDLVPFSALRSLLLALCSVLLPKARRRSRSAVKQQYDQRNERERDEQDYQPPLSRLQQTGAGLIPGGNDPVGVVCQLHRIFVELTLSGRHLLRRRVLPLVEHDLGADGCAFRGDRFLVSGTRFRRHLLHAGVLLSVVLDLCFKVDLHLSNQSDRVRSWKSLALGARQFCGIFRSGNNN